MLVSMKRFIGDAVMSAGMLNALEREYQPLTIICAKPVAQVLENPEVDRIFLPLDTKRKPWELMQSAMALRKHRFGVAVLVNHSFRSALTVRLAGIKKRIGHATEGRSLLLTDAVPYSEDAYEAWSANDLATPLGIRVPKETPRLPLRGEERAKGLDLLQGATVGIQPGARFASKMLPLEKIRDVAQRLQNDGHKLAFLGASEEKESALTLAKELEQPVVDLVGATDIRGSLGALSHLKLMIGADTGLMHMAVGVGAPTVTIFGPTPAKKWGHYYEPHQVLQSPDGDMSRLDVEELYRAARARLE
jgi:ADP-heptose:LPS heptosyltransferase